MTLFDQIPAVIRILFVFALVLFAIRKSLTLGSAFVIGATCLGLTFNMAPADIVRSMLLSLLQPKTLALAVIVSLILVLSHSMESGGQMARLLDCFQGLLNQLTTAGVRSDHAFLSFVHCVRYPPVGDVT